MTDIVERLNEIQPHWCVASLETKTVYEVGQICAYAKTEIERLREALRDFACWCDENECQEYDDVGLRYCCYRNKSRAALGEGKE